MTYIDTINDTEGFPPFALSEDEAKNNVQLFVLDDMGYIKYRFDGDECELYAIYVKREYRHQGIGIKLLERLYEICDNNQKLAIFVNSSADPLTQRFGQFMLENKFNKISDSQWRKNL